MVLIRSPLGLLPLGGILAIMIGGAGAFFALVLGTGMGKPGTIVSLLLIGFLIVAAVLAIWLVDYLATARTRRVSRWIVWGVLVSFFVILGIASASLYTVKRTAFTYTPFEEIEPELRKIAETPVAQKDIEIPLNRWFGSYYIDVYAVDSRGGVYFRTSSGPDGLGPDTVSRGFCLNPNPEGSPFGAKYYKPEPIGDGWYKFEASNDYF